MINNNTNKGGMTMGNKFERFVFGTFLADKGIAKYRDEKGRITVKVEHISRGVFQGLPLFFETNDEYEAWVDNIVDDDTATYNKAMAVSLLIDAILE